MVALKRSQKHVSRDARRLDLACRTANASEDTKEKTVGKTKVQAADPDTDHPRPSHDRKPVAVL